MKLTHVSVEGCGRFGTPARIEGFGPGVNILSARNEAGKSTLFRAIRTCLFERHSSTARDIHALATDGLSLPVSIRVGFEHEGKNYEIFKSLLKSKAASLRCDGAEIARNSEADERVWDLLGIAPRSARALDEASYGLLWVQQGHSFDVPEPSEGAVSVLNAVIQQEVGTLVGGERARQLLASVKEELIRYLTEGGRARTGGPLHAAIEENARLTAERMDVEARLAALDGKLDELARLRADFRQAADPATLQGLKSDLEESRRKLAEAEKAGEELKRLAADERQAHELTEAQREKLEALTRRASTIDAHRIRLKEIAAALAPLDQEAAGTATARKAVEERKAALDGEADELDKREQALNRLGELALKIARRERMAERLRQLEDFRARATGNEAALKTARVDDQALKALESLENEVARLRARLEAGAAQVTIAARPTADVRVNGAPVASPASRAVTEPVTIEVGADVSIIVSPPQATLDAAAKAMAEHRDKLNALLAGCGAADAAELRRLRSERMELEEGARDLRAEHAALAVKESLGDEIEKLRAAIGEIDAEARRSLTDGTPPPPAEELERQKQEIGERRSAVRAARAGAEAQIATHGTALTRLAAMRATLRTQSEEIHARLGSELAVLPDERREEIVAACEAELGARLDAQRIKATLVAGKQASAPAEDEAQRLSARVERLTSAIRGQQDKADQLRDRIARLEGEVQVAGGDGLGERAATLKIQQDMAIAEEARITQRVEVLKLLQGTVKACHDRRRDQLNAPLRRHLKPFLHDVFPKAEIDLGENFAIAGLSRSGPGAELFGRLSLGTQEQIAVLVRLAMGAMICEKGTDVPIILDDALVYSDDERIEQMFDAINRAGRNQQVIVLTCRARSFTSLGGKQLQIVQSDG